MTAPALMHEGTSAGTHPPAPFVRLNPLVPAAVLLIVGLATGRAGGMPVPVSLGVGAVSLLLWLVAELTLEGRGRSVLAGVFLGLAIVAAGIAWWSLHQRHAGPAEIARLLADSRPAMVSARLRISTEPILRERPEDAPAFGTGTMSFVGTAAEVLTVDGWSPASGNAMVNIRGQLPLRRGQLVEIHGWGRRPASRGNPGEFDYARYLAASRIFASITATRACQVTVLDEAASPSWLEGFRRFVRSKLLAHTVREDERAGHTLAALLLGTRDPAMAPVSRDFTDAGAAHLLAISGAHIVLVALIVWWLLRWIIARPQARLVVTLLVVLVYVAATPCGPPILRAAIGAAMLTLGRLARRPTSAANLLAAAAIIVLLLRPADMLDAGFQLSFGCTLGLILLADRVHTGLFAGYLERRGQIARAIGTPLAARLQGGRYWLSQAVAANLVGAAVAAPLVAYHFCQLNLWAVTAGMLLLPIVTFTMVAGAVQIVAETLWLGALAAPLSTMFAGWMIAAAHHMARLPGSAVSIRQPPVWVVLLLYGALALWAMRRRLGVSRGATASAGMAALVIAASWYAATQEAGTTQLWALSAGTGDCVVLQTASGRVTVINAGSARHDIAGRVIEPFLRTRGIGRIDTLILPHADRTSASGAIALVDRFRPDVVLVSAADHRRRDFTNVFGADLLGRLDRRTRPVPLAAGGSVRLDAGVTCRVLWPPDVYYPTLRARESGAILCLEVEQTRVLIVHGGNELGLAAALAAEPDLRVDAAIVTGGKGPSKQVAARLRRLGVQTIVAARGDGVFNLAARGCARLTFERGGVRVEGFRDASEGF